MKAIVKATGVMIDVIPKFNANAQHSADNLYVCDNMVYRKCELDFLNVGNPPIDWEQRRYELVKDFTAGIISAHTVEEKNNSFFKNENGYKAVIDLSVSLADSLIKKLKGE